jgi:hypothetical protein
MIDGDVGARAMREKTLGREGGASTGAGGGGSDCDGRLCAPRSADASNARSALACGAGTSDAREHAVASTSAIDATTAIEATGEMEDALNTGRAYNV